MAAQLDLVHLSRLSCAERVAIRHLVERFGAGWVVEVTDWLMETIEEARDDGQGDGDPRLDPRSCHDSRHLSGGQLLAMRGLLRAAIDATSWERAEAEAE